uniref:Uncharacterized protein n=1 Tax=Haemonchus placei TaxID=6290 RepID=A0A0N4WGH7_HAEPC
MSLIRITKTINSSIFLFSVRVIHFLPLSLKVFPPQNDLKHKTWTLHCALPPNTVNILELFLAHFLNWYPYIAGGQKLILILNLISVPLTAEFHNRVTFQII